MPREYADGEVFLYRGRPIKLCSPCDAATASREPAALLGETLIVRPAPADERRRYLLYWYTAESEKIVRSLVPKWSKALAVRPREATVKYAATRWGSCSSSGRIFFNTRLSMLSDEVAEYIVVHELCHLKQMNHSAAFWDEVISALPGARALRRKLRIEEREAVL
ncbi:MAG: M48 family metallopeptidase [Synergistaceae bacterium]|jgi:predicted metal-dependent hydrolase|nr:M48 family metallopeptidase [Synergistaceae bacterium]